MILTAEITVSEPRKTITAPSAGSEGGSAQQHAAGTSLVELIQEQAVLRPQAIALSHRGAQLTYGDLDRRTNQLAHYLRAQGVGPGVLVGICMERSLDLVVGLLGIWKAGGAYVPLDPAYPTGRLRLMQQDSGMTMVLTQRNLMLDWVDADVRCIQLDTAKFNNQPSDRILMPRSAEDLAYLIFTSGSTGRPKGVQVEQGGLLNVLLSMRERPGLDLQDVLLAVTTLSFDIAGLELWLPLLAGGQVELAGRHEAGDGLGLLELMRRSRATVMQATPATWRMLLAAGWSGEPRIKVLCGGEAMTPALARSLLRCGESVWNLYGPTETTIWSSVSRVTEDSIREAGVSLGFPVANTQFYILDDERTPVPPGVSGELYIGGAGVARGYWRQPELTDQKFIPNPFGPGRLYQTGDRCRFASDGSVDYLGRVDRQVKLRGFRIELGEIESALSRLPSVGEAVVELQSASEDGDKRLVGYVVPAPGMAVPERQALSQHLRSMLPEHMIPVEYQFLEQLPLTPNGKVDRKALPVAGTRNRADAYEAPRTPIEEALSLFWAELFGLDQIGRRDRFFELGGHSLLATQLIARVRQALGVELLLHDLFEHSELQDLGRRIDALRLLGMSSIASINPDNPTDELPASPAQQRLWFIDDLHGATPEYNLALAFRLRGPLRGDALASSLDHVVQRHSTLRTVFRSSGGMVRQYVGHRVPVACRLATIEAAGLDDTPGGLERRLSDDASRPFSLAGGPLFRATLYRLADQDHALLLSVHHIIADGWSLDLLWKEITELYPSALRGEPPTLPPLRCQFGHFVLWQQAWLQEERVRGQMGYWKTQLEGAPAVLALPTDHPARGVSGPAPGARIPFRIDRELAGALQQMSLERHATLFMTFYSAFAILLGRHCGQEDVVIGVPVTNRYLRETEKLIGLFVNTLPMRLRLSGSPSYDELLVQAREMILDAHDHQDVPFDRIVSELRVERSIDQTPLCQAMLAFDNVVSTVSPLEGLEVRGLDLEPRAVQCDLLLRVNRHEDEIRAAFEYRSDRFDPATIEQMSAHYLTLLSSIVQGPHRAITDLPLMTMGERQRLLSAWNDTHVPNPQGTCIHHLFEVEAKTHADRVAVAFENELVSYDELNGRANRLAHHLRSLGVGPEVLVGLCLWRSVQMIVGLLGILKAGGAYVPIDPSLPSDRLEFMLSDAGISVVISEGELLAVLEACPSAEGRIIVCLDRDSEQIDAQPTRDPEHDATPANLAYVIYTSGSTGRPKGAMIEHQSIYNRLLWMQAAHPLTADDRVLQKTPFSFDVSVWEFFWPLMFGARLVVARPAGEQDPDYLIELIRRCEISHLHFVPSMLQIFLSAQDVAKCLSVTRVFCSGETLGASLMNRFFEVFQCELHNLYGPTEAAVDVCGWRCRPDSSTLDSVPIGRPIANVRLYVLDPGLEPVPIGIAGELHIAGVQVGRGYLNRPDLTRERFVDNPFGPGRLYKTGDRVRYRADGNLEFLGRYDDQVKIRGFRVELGEIETVLSQHPAVREAAVVARMQPSGHLRLVAYVAGGDQQLGRRLLSEVRAYLRARLPDYMVPGVIVVLGQLPLSSHGKVDRQALPEPDLHALEDSDAGGMPRTVVERVLAEIWSKLLDLGSVGRRANFFQLGGDSITNLQAISLARSKGVQLLRVRCSRSRPSTVLP